MIDRDPETERTKLLQDQVNSLQPSDFSWRCMCVTRLVDTAHSGGEAGAEMLQSLITDYFQVHRLIARQVMIKCHAQSDTKTDTHTPTGQNGNRKRKETGKKIPHNLNDLVTQTL